MASQKALAANEVPNPDLSENQTKTIGESGPERAVRILCSAICWFEAPERVEFSYIAFNPRDAKQNVIKQFERRHQYCFVA